MENKKVHFMGVGGAGCSAVFAIAKNLGFQVSGCDNESDSPYLDSSLKSLTVVGHSPDHVKGNDLLVYSPAITAFDPTNPELVEARKKVIEIMPWDQFVAESLLKDKFVIAVAGTHGKGTVTSMIGVAMEKAGLDPTCLVGAVVMDWGRNYRVGKSKYFVLEADEYSEKLLRFRPNIGVITNIEFDHPEMFEDLDEIKKLFSKFANCLKEDSSLIVGPKVEVKNPHGKTFQVLEPVSYEIKMLGSFNKLNTAIAVKVLQELQIEEQKITDSLQNFNGVSRRFEFIGEEKGVLVFDDYAHHPTAIKETVHETRIKFPNKKIWVVYQPHLFSRTKALFGEFVKVFKESEADTTILVDIFEARETDNQEISSQDIVKAIGLETVKYMTSLEEAANFLVTRVSGGDMILTVGAGDIYTLAGRILEKLKGAG